MLLPRTQTSMGVCLRMTHSTGLHQQSPARILFLQISCHGNAVSTLQVSETDCSQISPRCSLLVPKSWNFGCKTLENSLLSLSDFIGVYVGDGTHPEVLGGGNCRLTY